MSPESLGSIEKVFALLECFSQEQPELGVREAARLLNLSTSTAGRLLVTLRDLGVLSQNPTNRAYRLGGKVLGWAGVYTASFDLRLKALPALRDLLDSTRETVSLYVAEGDERVCIERFESPHSLRLVTRVGRRMPLYAGAGGKAILAFLPETQRERVIELAQAHPITEKTICREGDLDRELNHIRQVGYSVSRGEWVLEACGVGAPVFDHQGAVQGAITVSGPTQRFTDDAILRYIPLVVEAAGDVSRELGYTANGTKAAKEKTL